MRTFIFPVDPPVYAFPDRMVKQSLKGNDRKVWLSGIAVLRRPMLSKLGAFGRHILGLSDYRVGTVIEDNTHLIEQRYLVHCNPPQDKEVIRSLGQFDVVARAPDEWLDI